MICLITLFLAGRGHLNERFGMRWALLMGFSFLPMFYFRTGLIDPYFNFFMFASVWVVVTSSQRSAAALGGVSMTVRDVPLERLAPGCA